MNPFRDQLNAASRRVSNARRRFERKGDPQSAEDWLKAIDSLRAVSHLFTVAAMPSPTNPSASEATMECLPGIM